ncbi:adenosylcobinamide-phosphate synthase CbiB [Natronospora cellulosivora (SeqCode)]
MEWFLILFFAVFLDFIIGDPPRWPHPVRLIGFLITKYEALIRKIRFLPLKLGGFILVVLTVLTVLLVLNMILNLMNLIHPLLYRIISVYFLFTTIAARCLHFEVQKVYKALKKGDLLKARKFLSYLVGRDTDSLNEREIIKATVETIAENTVDGVLAPLFFILMGIYFGMPVHLAFLYKTINTMDSMIGYIQEPYKDIGYAAAKIDDLANYIPARIGSLIMLLAGVLLGYDGLNGYKILKRDRRNHRSPNSAYPESLVAGLLNIQLGGSSKYFGQKLFKPTIGDANSIPNAENIKDAVKIMYLSEVLILILFLPFVFNLV